MTNGYLSVILAIRPEDLPTTFLEQVRRRLNGTINKDPVVQWGTMFGVHHFYNSACGPKGGGYLSTQTRSRCV